MEFTLTVLTFLSVIGFLVSRVFKRIWDEGLLHMQGICGRCKSKMVWAEPKYTCPKCGRVVTLDRND